MHRRNHATQKAFYRQQASECAAAASTTSVAEVKQAYLDLEQGWLSLTPNAEISRYRYRLETLSQRRRLTSQSERELLSEVNTKNRARMPSRSPQDGDGGVIDAIACGRQAVTGAYEQILFSERSGLYQTRAGAIEAQT